MSSSAYHIPVLPEASLTGLGIGTRQHGLFVDATFGGGGHTRLMLDRLDDRSSIYGFDQDPDALANVPEDARFQLIPENFRFMRNFLRLAGVRKVDGILADLGVSSHQFDQAERGFSIRGEAPLDMRMNPKEGKSAADLIADCSPVELTRIFRQYGEIKRPDKAAYAVESARQAQRIHTTRQLMDALVGQAPRGRENKFFAQVFQALRIEVNDEMGALRTLLESSLDLLPEGGRLVVISYHSLEDRLVKHFMRSGNFEDALQRDFKGQLLAPFDVLSRKAIVAEDEEIEANPRARSARLRVAQRTGYSPDPSNTHAA
ncbi:MAG: 16S rRNA (cytosine(1402)-N(4))-methyltransferase RsmH [Bacteroidetes bacterium]|jgi:16S rRNA (cytosine1402-N4)-methyltransferase|nr:16S rRNA (cytosine(1402)-N(4))-methyltransferase RsmH [Bacteroidota bacterium]